MSSPLQVLLDSMEFEATKKMLILLALNMTKDTKVSLVPYGTREWRIIFPPKGSPWKFKDDPTIYGFPGSLREEKIELVPFFGLFVAYCEQNDTLYYWSRNV
jgi:hypothetical protein